MLAQPTSGETRNPATTTTTTTCSTSLPWELSDCGSSLNLRFAGSAGADTGKNYTTLTQQLGWCRKEEGEKLYDDGEIGYVLQEDKHE